MSTCNEKVPVFRLLALLVLCASVYLYLYTNVFDGMKTSSVYRVVEGDLQAVWKDKFGSVSYYLKLMEQSDNSLKIEVSADKKSETTLTSPEPTTAAALAKTLLLEKYQSEIMENTTLPLLTLFTTWTDSGSKHLLHNITVKNWVALKPFIIPVVFTNESSVRIECEKMGWEVLPISVSAVDGIPVLKYMYSDVMKAFNSTFYAYSNGDILFTETLIDTLLNIMNSTVDLNAPTLIVGQRTNVGNVTLEEGVSWQNVTRIAKKRGEVFTGWAEDYFITCRNYPWGNMPEVVIGRRAYDNWLVYNSRKSKHSVIDATKTLLAVHQTDKAGNFEGHGHTNRDYNHNLLIKMYKKIKYNAGVIECIEKYTIYENDTFLVKSKTLPKACTV